MRLTALLMLAFVVSVSECAKILGMFMMPAYSHQSVYRSLMEELASRGHELTYLTPFPGILQHPNVTEISMATTQKTYNEMLHVVKNKECKATAFDTYNLVIDMTLAFCDEQLSIPEVKKLITEGSKGDFDLVIMEHFGFTPLLGLAEVFDVPVVGITSMDTTKEVYELFGAPSNPVMHPDPLFYSLPACKLTFFQRLQSLIEHIGFKLFCQSRDQEKMMKLFSKHFPGIDVTQRQMEDRIALMMINTNLMHSIRPTLPNIIQLGNLHLKAPKQQPEGRVKNFLDSSENGVIYMAFGTSIRTTDFSPKLHKVFTNTFAKLNLNVLWKFETENVTGLPENVMVSKWLPQADVLAHPNVKMMIFHGGQQTMEEGIDREVPMLVIPFIEEQTNNARSIAEKGLGTTLSFDDVNEKAFSAAIKKTLEPKYKNNVKRFKKLMNDQPMTSREKAAWWVEYVLRNKNCDHLRYPGRFVPFYQEFCLDILAFLIVSAVLMFLGTKTVSRTIRKHFGGENKKVDHKKNK